MTFPVTVAEADRMIALAISEAAIDARATASDFEQEQSESDFTGDNS